MAGDLSLSQSLGGLRIANPDDDQQGIASPTSPDTHPPPSARPHPPPTSSHSSGSTLRAGATSPALAYDNNVLVQPADPMADVLGYDPDLYSGRHGQVPSQSSSTLQSREARLPFPQQQPQQTQPDTSVPRSRLSKRQSMPLGHQAQQAIQFPNHSYNIIQQARQPAIQTTSARPISGLYNLNNTSSSNTSSSQDSSRYRDDVGSSDGSASGLARNGSRSTRPVQGREGNGVFRQSSQHVDGGNGPLPPRRNSKRAQLPTSAQGSGYDSVQVPYAASASMPQTAEEWRDRGASVSTRTETDASGQTQTRTIKKGVKDFTFGRTLGEGSYSTVLAATDRQNLKEYAIKVLDKRHIIKEKKVKYVNIERDTLNRLTEHPGIVRLYYTFQDERSLYFVLDLASGGELLGVLKKLGSFDVECTRFYGAEILDSVAYMHSRGVIHRDLKPENVLLDREMHVKITDFGTAKILPDPRAQASAGQAPGTGSPMDGTETDRAVSFVGTAEYVSPELLRDKNACKASDLWAFGCIIYQLLAGRPPFKAANEYLTFQKILALDYSFPDGFPELARDLIQRLLVLEPERRLSVEHVMNHRFFDGVRWGKDLWKVKAPRLKAYVAPAAPVIKLNGSANKDGGLAAAAAAAALSPPSGVPTTGAQPQQRPQLRSVTELPPPSQLDIDWSPILTHNNERILKLGNLLVLTCSQPHSPNSKTGNGESGTPTEKPKFRGLFGGSGQKKRERLVLITSSARLLIAAAGGNEKKTKLEVNCLSSDCSWKSYVDAKGLTAWQLDTKDKHLVLEDPRATTSDPAGSKYSTQEWLDALEQARELATASRSITGSYSDSASLLHLNGVPATNMSPSADSLGGMSDAAMPMPGPQAGERHMLRQTLRKRDAEEPESGVKGRKRFSKRHSKGGVSAVF